MRTTLNIDDDVLDLAKAIAQNRGISVGEAVSDLARRGAQTGPSVREESGFPVFQVSSTARQFTAEDVYRALEEPEADAGPFLQGPG